MIEKLKPKSEFSRNVLTLMSGTTVAQAIPIAISPILTRIYTPEDFGLFGTFLALSTILGGISNAKYELAIMLPRKDEDAINIFALGFIISSIFSLLLLVFILLFDDYLIELLGNETIRQWIYFIPLIVFFIGFFNILNYFNNRKKNYRDIANSKIVKSIVLAVVQLSVGLVKGGVIGLVSGQIVSQMFANVRLLKNIINDKNLMSKISKVKMIALAKKYKNFPKFLILAHGMNTMSSQSPFILLSTFFNATIAGFFLLTQRVVGMPMSLVARSIGDVFREEASSQFRKNGECKAIYISTLKRLLIIGTIPFILLFMASPTLFIFVFGDDWGVAGVYAQILTPMFFLQFITSPLSNMFMIAEKQQLDLSWQIFLFVLIMTSLFSGKYVFDDSFMAISLFSLSYSLSYIVNGIMTYKFSKGIQ